MIDRCYCSTSTAYPNYGGRGIAVCDAWRDFRNFLADMGERPSRAHSLDRIDGAKGYEPANCRWATGRQQAMNKRTTRRLTAFGETRPLVEWAEQFGLKPKRVELRLSRGWDAERAIGTPIR